VHVDFPGGMVNIGKKLLHADEEITATGRILLQTNVNFPGGNVSVSPAHGHHVPDATSLACIWGEGGGHGSLRSF